MQKTPQDKLFEMLIDEELPKLRGLAFRILKNAADVDDAIQEALVKAYQRFNTFHNDKAALSTWVCRIAVNCSYDILRKRASEQRKLDSYTPNSSNTIDTEPLTRAIADLPEPYRDAITFGALSGYDGKAAAKLLGISTNTLYQRIFKAKQMLKTTLSQEN